MSFVDDFNNRAAQSATQSGVSHSWDDFFRQQEQQRILKELQDKNTKTAQPKGNFLTSLIPTGGGVAGALGGAAGGAAIGSVVPGVGTAIGGLLGAILGGAGGSALGKVGENAVEGEADLGKGVGQEALLGGVTSLPLGAGFKLAKAGFKATTGIGKKTAGDLIQEAGVQTIGKGAVNRGVASGQFDDRAGLTAERLQGGNLPGTTINTPQPTTPNQALSTSLSGKLTNAGNKALLSQYGTIGKSVANATNPTETISQLANAGITRPVDAERLGKIVTGSNGLVTKAVSDSVGKAGGVNIDSARQVFLDAVESAGIVDKDRKSLEQIFNAQMNKLRGGTKGSIATTVNPSEVLGTMKSLEKRIANLQGRGSNNRLSTPEREDQANVLKLVKDELEDSLYTGAGANKQLAGALTPDLRNKLVAANPGNAQWQNYVDNNIMGAKTVGDLRSSMAPFVRAGNILEEADKNAITYGGRVGNAFASGGFKDMIGQAATNVVKNPASRLAGNTLRAAGRITSGTTDSIASSNKQRVGQSILPLTARQGGARLLIAETPEQTQLDENGLTQEDYASLENNPIFGGSEYTNSPTDLSTQQPTNPFGISLSDVAGQLQIAIQNGDSKGYATLSDLYDKINDYEKTNASSNNALGATAKSGLASSANAVNTLGQLESLFAQAGGGGGRIGGGVQNFLGNAGFNNNVDLYNSQANSTITQLAKALNGGGQVTDADARVVIDALPKVTDNPEVAAQKFAALRQRLQVAAQNIAQYGGGSTDLSSILSQYSQ